jgi:Leucine-rich repeat (LRR) protein
MIHNQIIDINNFCDSYNPIIKSYATEFLNKIASLDNIQTLLFDDISTKRIKELIDFADESSDNYISSFIYRLVGVKEIIFCRENKKQLDTSEVWKMISKSIRIIPSELTISSIGSQGFLSIPLYKQDASLENFDFIRLHIWDDSLDKYMDLQKCQDFSIHSHTFFAKSWIITGKVKNDRYEYI